MPWWFGACAHPPVAPATTQLVETVAPDAVALPPDLFATRDGDGWQVTVRWRGPADAVAWTGSFARWAPDAVPLARGPDGVWTATARLPAGRHAYKWIVDGVWQADPRGIASEDDGFQGRNSLLFLGRDAVLADRVGAVDGTVEIAGLRHDPRHPADLEAEGAGWRVRLRTLPGDATAVWVVPEGAPPIPLTRAPGRGEDVWTGVFQGGPRYGFRFADGAAPVAWAWTGQTGDAATAAAPAWSAGAVWYQIFPDRWRNADPTNDPDDVWPWNGDWAAPDRPDRPRRETVWGRRLGGDLAGISADLPALRALGVDALYLNPVWAAPSPHRYDATTWVHVDPVLGGGEPLPTDEPLTDPSRWTWTASDLALRALIARAHDLGLRVVLDGVFNHVGATHPAWRDVLARGRDSAFAGWFTLTRWDPPTPVGWGGYTDLPALADGPDGFRDPGVAAHILAVTHRWMDPDGDGDPRDGVDGWRLDVADEVPAAFWRVWRASVRSWNPEAAIIGEVWSDPRPWVRGDTFDATTGYPWTERAWSWVGDRANKPTATAVARALTSLQAQLPQAATDRQWLLLDSHDTDRVASRMANPDRGFDQRNRAMDDPSWDNGPPDAAAWERVRLLVAWQLAWPGAPVVYHGDDLGLWGGDDPDNRRPIPWPERGPYPDGAAIDPSRQAIWREALALRRDHPALRDGDLRWAVIDDVADVLGFVRGDDREEVLVLLHPGPTPVSVDLSALGDGWSALDAGAVWGEVPARGVARWARARSPAVAPAPPR